jgi:hypothetical protein
MRRRRSSWRKGDIERAEGLADLLRSATTLRSFVGLAGLVACLAAPAYTQGATPSPHCAEILDAESPIFG